MSSKKQSKYWCFTINNPGVSDVPTAWPLTTLSHIQYMIWQYEIGEEGTEHIQGYLCLFKILRFSGIKKFNAKAHWETRGGSHFQCIAYCSKDDTRKPNTKTVYFGTDPFPLTEYKPSGKGMSKITSDKHAVLIDIKDSIEKGVSIKNIARDQFPSWLRHYRAFSVYNQLIAKERDSKTNVTVLFGPTGTGKSSWIHKNCPEAYWKGKSEWWDNYANNKFVVIDEFYGWLPWDYLLRLTDRYPFLVESKGGHVQFNSEYIFITSNLPWDCWYKKIENMAPLERRIDNIWEVLELGCEFNVIKGLTPEELLIDINKDQNPEPLNPKDPNDPNILNLDEDFTEQLGENNKDSQEGPCTQDIIDACFLSHSSSFGSVCD